MFDHYVHRVIEMAITVALLASLALDVALLGADLATFYALEFHPLLVQHVNNPKTAVDRLQKKPSLPKALADGRPALA